MKDKIQSQLRTWDIAQKIIIVRADCNIPLQDGKIVDDFRLTRLLPTLQYIIEQNGKIILLTHIGRPQNYDSAISTRHLLSWFHAHGINLAFAATFGEIQHHLAQSTHGILFENLRFWPEEHVNNKAFAQQFAQHSDYFVQDAFGSLHRSASSIVALAHCFAREKRTIGFLVEDELTHLQPLLHDIKQPFMILVGGKKAADKLSFAAQLHDATVILLPATLFTYLQAQHISVGASYVDPDGIAAAQELQHHAVSQHLTMVIPPDILVGNSLQDSNLHSVMCDAFATCDIGLTIGPVAEQAIQNMLRTARTLLWTGTMGVEENDTSLAPMIRLCKNIGMLNAYRVAAGGDTISMLRMHHLEDNFSFLSTGGSATLAYVATGNLVGLQVIIS